MRINVADLLRAATGESLVVDMQEPLPFDEEGVRLDGPVRGRVALMRDHAGILVQGDLAAVVSTACSRCLRPVDVEVVFRLEEEFHPTVPLPGGPPVLAEADREPATDIDQHHVLDLSEVMRQSLAVALPWNVLCRRDCAGLCPSCGINRNVGACACEPAPDPRWSVLGALLSKAAADDPGDGPGDGPGRPGELHGGSGPRPDA